MSDENAVVVGPKVTNVAMPDRRTKNLAEVKHPDLFHIPEDTILL